MGGQHLYRRCWQKCQSFLLVFVIFGYAGLSLASEQGIDVVLVMDSSGSMKKTDPKELRKPAAKLFISLLGKDDRASVVSFSDQGYPVIFLTSVDGKKNQQKLFKATDKISSRGYYTNLYGAIDSAMKVLEKSHDKEHRKIIVLMSDGEMDMGCEEKSETQTNKLENELLQKLKNKNVELQTIAFTDKSDQKLLSKIARETGGKFFMAKTDKKLHEIFASIFEHNKSPNMLPFVGDKFTIDDSIEEVTIIGSKGSPDTKLILHAPDKKQIDSESRNDNVTWFVSEMFDMITIQKPKSGKWKLESSAGKNKAYVITNLKLHVQTQPEQLTAGSTVNVTAWLEDNKDQVTNESVLSTVKMSAHLSHSDESEIRKVLKWANKKKKKKEKKDDKFTADIKLEKPGEYKLKISAIGGTFAREREMIVNVQEKTDEEKSKEDKEKTEKKADVKDGLLSPDTGKNLKEISNPKQQPVSKKKKKEDSGVLVGVLILVGVNILLAGSIWGGIHYKRKKKNNLESDDEENDEKVEE
jgi:hypothetical protein